jgi:hypothetical protein
LPPRRRLPLEQAPRFREFKSTDIQIAAAHLRGGLIGDINSRAMARFREAADLERNHCFADSWSADLECDGKIPLRRQALARFVLAARDRRHNGGGNLLVELAGIGRSSHLIRS